MHVGKAVDAESGHHEVRLWVVVAEGKQQHSNQCATADMWLRNSLVRHLNNSINNQQVAHCK